MPLHAEEVNMLEGLDGTELASYLEENPWIVLLFKIDIIEAANNYVAAAAPEEEYKLDLYSLLELSKARDAFEQELEIS